MSDIPLRLKNAKAKDKERSRVFSPKVSTGCTTCKIRRIKCDEAKPNCVKCTSTGRKCDGYLAEKSKAGSRSSRSSPQKSLVPINNTINTSIPGTEEELRTFDFFRERTVQQLCGLFDSDLWNRLILQACHHAPAIFHAVVALGSLHEQFERNPMRWDTDRSGFALKQYLKSIKCLVQPIQQQGEQNSDLALMTCALFVCFETLRGNLGTALSHIDGGIKIVSETICESNGEKAFWKTSTSPFVPPKTINLIFVRLENQVVQVAAGRERLLLSRYSDDKEIVYYEDIPNTFATIEEARNSLDYIWAAGIRSANAVIIPKQEPSREFQTCIRDFQAIFAIKLKNWNKAFESFVRRNRMNLDDVKQIGIHTLRIQKIETDMFLEQDHQLTRYDECVWDKYTNEFERINAHAQFITQIANKPLPNGEPRATFSLDNGILLPLYFVASKCRISKIRRRAIEITKSVPRQEGLLNGLLTAKVAEMLIDLEEEGLGVVQVCEDIPRERRIAGVECDLGDSNTDARTASLVFIPAKSKDGAEGRESVHEKVTW